jgi:hypothetical protein
MQAPTAGWSADNISIATSATHADSAPALSNGPNEAREKQQSASSGAQALHTVQVRNTVIVTRTEHRQTCFESCVVVNACSDHCHAFVLAFTGPFGFAV